MRALLVAAVVAVVAVIGLLVVDRPTRRAPPSDTTQDGNGGPGNGTPNASRLPDLASLVADRARDPGLQASLADYVATCKERGPEVVPQLLALLEGGADTALLPKWSFVDGELQGYATLRSVYLAALAAIEGTEATAALRSVLGETDSLEETYLIALALHGRGAGQWSGPLLERTANADEPVRLHTARAAVALAAGADPETTSSFLYAHAPRGEDTTLPRVHAPALEAMPLDSAARVAEALLTDRDVTVGGKSLYLRAYCRRMEVEALQTLQRLAERGDLSEPLRLEAAYALADSQAFEMDAFAYQQALAEHDPAREREARARFELRMEQVRLFLGTALGFDVDTSDDPRAAALRRKLDRQAERLR